MKSEYVREPKHGVDFKSFLFLKRPLEMSLASLTTHGIEQQKLEEHRSSQVQQKMEQQQKEEEQQQKRSQEAQRKQQQRAQQQRQKMAEEQMKKHQQQKEEKRRGELQTRIRHYRNSFPGLEPIYRDLSKCTIEQLKEEIKCYEEQLSFPKAKGILQNLWLSGLKAAEYYCQRTEYECDGLTFAAAETMHQHDELFEELACKYHSWLVISPEMRLVHATVQLFIQVQHAKRVLKQVPHTVPDSQQYEDL